MIFVIGIWFLVFFIDIIVYGKVINDEECYYCGVIFLGIIFVFCVINIFFFFIIILVFYVIVCYKFFLWKVLGEGNS